MGPRTFARHVRVAARGPRASDRCRRVGPPCAIVTGTNAPASAAAGACAIDGALALAELDESARDTPAAGGERRVRSLPTTITTARLTRRASGRNRSALAAPWRARLTARGGGER